MAYKGWTYEWDYEHDDGDVRKIEHWAVHEDGRKINLDFSPYLRGAKAVCIEAMVELDFPKRSDMPYRTSGPIYEEDLLELYVAHLKRKLETETT